MAGGAAVWPRLRGYPGRRFGHGSRRESRPRRRGGHRIGWRERSGHHHLAPRRRRVRKGLGAVSPQRAAGGHGLSSRVQWRRAMGIQQWRWWNRQRRTVGGAKRRRWPRCHSRFGRETRRRGWRVIRGPGSRGRRLWPNAVVNVMSPGLRLWQWAHARPWVGDCMADHTRWQGSGRRCVIVFGSRTPLRQHIGHHGSEHGNPTHQHRQSGHESDRLNASRHGTATSMNNYATRQEHGRCTCKILVPTGSGP